MSDSDNQSDEKNRRRRRRKNKNNNSIHQKNHLSHEKYDLKYPSKKNNQLSHSSTSYLSTNQTKEIKKKRIKGSRGNSSSPTPKNSKGSNNPSYRLYDPNIQQIKSTTITREKIQRDSSPVNGQHSTINPYLTSSIETLKQSYHPHTDNGKVIFF